MLLQELLGKLEVEGEKSPSKKNEDIQHLVELGYLPLFQATPFFSRQVALAKQQFLEDLQTASYIEAPELELYQKIGPEEFVSYFLRKVTDIDEGVVFKSLPAQKELSLKSRIIHYRLDLFGMWIQPLTTQSPYTTRTDVQLRVLGEHVKLSTLETANLLADIEKFTDHLLKLYPQQDFILSFKSPNTDDDMRKKLQRRGAFKSQLVDDLDGRTDFFKQLKKNVLRRNDKNIDTDFLSSNARNPLKLFLLRLIQVHQWKNGFYSGLLDDDMGPVTLQSTLDSIAFYNDGLDGGKKIKEFQVLTYVTDGYFLFNALFFLRKYAIEKDSQAGDLWSNMHEEVRNAKADKQEAFHSNLEGMRKQLDGEEDSPKQKRGLLARIYFGIGSFIKKLAGMAKKVFKWVVKKVTKFLNVLKNAFRDFFKNLKTGIKAFLDGIKFILGNKTQLTMDDGASGWLMTKFRLDGDVTSIANSNNLDLIKKHIDKNKYMVSTLGFALTVVSVIVKLVFKALNFLSWPLLLINIVKAFKSIKASYQTLYLKPV